MAIKNITVNNAQPAKETTILALFEEIAPAASALTRLKSDARIDGKDLMVLSSVPFPEKVLESDTSPSNLPKITLAFAFAGIAVGLALAGFSAVLYVIPTGGKPILSGPPIGIICYEMMMLSALSATFFAALYEMRLPSWRAKVYDPRISEGLIGIAAHCSNPKKAEEAERLLRESGAVAVRHDARAFE